MCMGVCSTHTHVCVPVHRSSYVFVALLFVRAHACAYTRVFVSVHVCVCCVRACVGEAARPMLRPWLLMLQGCPPGVLSPPAQPPLGTRV